MGMNIKVTVEVFDNDGQLKGKGDVLITEAAVDRWPEESVIKVDDLVAAWARKLFNKHKGMTA